MVKVFHGALLIMLCILFLFFGWQLAARVLWAQELPEILGYSQLAVLSGSMEPAISAGDLIVIHRQADYDAGDVITFADEGNFTTHRILEAESGKFQTKGDANNIPDSQPVTEEQIRGKVVLVLPAFGNVILFLRSPAGIAAIALAGFLILIAGEHTRQGGEEEAE